MTTPNLVFIYTDEQAYRTMAAYGNERIDTPNLDRLASISCVFEKAYVTQPVCTPSRSTLLTGQWPHTNGCLENNVPLSPSTRCFPEMLPAGRYVTGHIGKWHLGDEIFGQHGFDTWVSIEDGYHAQYSKPGTERTRSDYHRFLVDKGYEPGEGNRFSRSFTARLPEDLTKAAFVGDRSAEFIRKNASSPFALFINFLEPHMPYFGPRDDQYAPESVDVPITLNVPPSEAQPLKARVYAEGYREKGHSGLPLETDADWRRLIANYWGLCSQVDAQVGKILDALETSGVMDNTIVVFTSDHGDMMGAHRLTAKCVQFEEALRVPLLIRLPQRSERVDVTGPVSHIDLVPTLLDAMHVEIDPQCQGQSLLPELNSSPAPSIERNAYIEWNGMNTGVVGEEDGKILVPGSLSDGISSEKLSFHIRDPIRTVVTPDGWKLNRSYLPAGENESELYNLNDDPGETNNMFEARPDVVAGLEEQLNAWRRRVGDV